jgi:hypothetical protein
MKKIATQLLEYRGCVERAHAVRYVVGEVLEDCFSATQYVATHIVDAQQVHDTSVQARPWASDEIAQKNWKEKAYVLPPSSGKLRLKRWPSSGNIADGSSTFRTSNRSDD